MAEKGNQLAELVIDVTARLDRLEGELKKAEKQATDSGKRMEKQLEKAAEPLGGKMVQNAMRALAALGMVEVGIGALNVATKVFTGDIEDAADALKRLPMGIGPVASQLETLLGTMTGITAEIEAAEKATAESEAAIKEMVQNRQLTLSLERDRLKVLQQISDEMALLAAAPEEREALAARLAGLREVEAAEQKIQDLRERQFQATASGQYSQVGVINARIRALSEFVSKTKELVDARARERITSRAGAALGVSGGKVETLRTEVALGGLEGFDRERAAAQQQYQQMLRDAEEFEAQKARIADEAQQANVAAPTEQLDALQRDADQVRALAEQLHQQRMDQIERQVKEQGETERKARMQEAEQRQREMTQRQREMEREAKDAERKQETREREARGIDDRIRGSRFASGREAIDAASAGSRLAGGGSIEQLVRDNKPQKVESDQLATLVDLFKKWLQRPGGSEGFS